MEFLVREATEQDYEGLSDILAEVDAMHSEALPHIFVTPEEPARSKEYFSDTITDENTALFIAEKDSQVIGLISIHIRESISIPIMVERRYAYIDNIAVAKEFRGSTIGKELMKEAERWAIQKGVSELELNVWDFNQEAITFFQRLGYTMARHGMWKPV